VTQLLTKISPHNCLVPAPLWTILLHILHQVHFSHRGRHFRTVPAVCTSTVQKTPNFQGAPARSTKSNSNARNKDGPGGQNEPPEERGAAQGPSAFLFVEAEDTTADQKIMQHVMRDYLRKKRQRGVEFRHVRKGATGWETTGEASQASPGEPKPRKVARNRSPSPIPSSKTFLDAGDVDQFNAYPMELRRLDHELIHYCKRIALFLYHIALLLSIEMSSLAGFAKLTRR
jgi:hypothetical protein